MDQREHRYEPIGICNRLYNFIMKSAYALKSVTLGQPLNQHMAKSQNGARFVHGNDRLAHPRDQVEAPGEGAEQSHDDVKQTDSSVSSNSSCKDHEQEGKELLTTKNDGAGVAGGKDDTQEEVPSALVLPEAKAPKKSVSINDRVEESYASKKAGRKKSRQKSSSFEQYEINEPKPLKPILKVGSDSGDRSSSFVNPSNSG